MGSITGERCEEPCERELCDGHAIAGGDAAEGLRRRVFGLEQLTARAGIPGQEADAATLTIIQRLLMTPVGQTVSILDSRDGHDLFGVFDLGRRHLTQADVADLALLLHAAERAERLLKRGARIDSM